MIITGVTLSGQRSVFDTETKTWNPPIIAPAEIHEQVLQALNASRAEEQTRILEGSC